jgi:hypothetical protein
MVLTKQQHNVFDNIKEFITGDASVFILRGYAGTGKTTMVKEIAEFIRQSCILVLMAPTGRAARVLSDKTGYNASTIHRAIYDFDCVLSNEAKDIAETEFKMHFPVKQSKKPIVAIIDEASMMCSRTVEHELYRFGTDNLMDDLLTFVRPNFGGKVIFVGDPAQLPPVGENVSNALNAEFFVTKGLKVMQAELREVLRQTGDSIILKNAIQIRNLLESDKRNRMVFDEKKGDVETLSASELLDHYLEDRQRDGKSDSVVICYSNRGASENNKYIRKKLYGDSSERLQVGDILLIVQNNYHLDRMNGEFVPVLKVGEEVSQTAPVYVQDGGQKVRKTITLRFQHIETTDSKGNRRDCMVLLDLLFNDESSLSIDAQKALYINFCMRHPELKQNSKPFHNALGKDEYFNCLRAKFGYAVTGHKCQGGEWAKVYVDYSGRTGLSDECLRWAYTVTTRARETLYISNLPHITQFSKFRIEEVQACSKINEECRILDKVEPSPYHDITSPDFLHAKYWCIQHNMAWTPYRINSITSKPYQEIYYIETPDGVERYDIRYKKGGIFAKSVAYALSQHSTMVSMILDNEREMPLIFNYVPSDSIREKLFNMIRCACDGLSIQITNVVEHSGDYSVNYYFRTSDSYSYIKVYIDASGFVTYAKPMSLLGKDDSELKLLIEEITAHFI